MRGVLALSRNGKYSGDARRAWRAAIINTPRVNGDNMYAAWREIASVFVKMAEAIGIWRRAAPLCVDVWHKWPAAARRR